MKIIGLGALLTVVGLIFEIMAFTEPDFTIGSRIFAIVCGLIFLAIPLMVGGTLIAEMLHGRKQKNKPEAERQDWKSAEKPTYMSNSSELIDSAKKDIEKFLPRKEQPAYDFTEQEKFLTRFRSEYRDFFARFGRQDNSALQYDATQLYWGVLALQKKRLDRKGITMDFSSERKGYRDIEPVKSASYFDGKYQVTEISESIAVRKEFKRDGKSIFSKTLDRAAHIIVTSAKKLGASKVICPGCGAETTVENLIDGCDYCGTKFRVSDLENKVSAFRLRDDYEIQYERYKAARADYNKNVFWKQFAVYFVIVCIVYLCNLEMLIESAGNLALGLLFVPLAAGAAAGMFAYLGLCFFWMFLFPVIQVKKSAEFYSKRRLDMMKKRYRQDTAAEANVRKYDEHFSVAAFYSELTNKLASVHFADTQAGANAFFETDRMDLPEKYKDTVDMDIADINVNDFRVADGMQQLRVDATLELLTDREQRLRREKEKLRLTLVRAEQCRTEAVCAPAVLKCRGCGASIALEEGKTCAHCGRVLDLSEFDWVIREYETV